MSRPAILLLSTLVAALGSFLFGFDTAVISGATDALQRVYGLSDSLLGFTVSSALFGTMAGAIFAGKPADLLGRRPLLVATAVGFIVSALGCALAGNWHAFLCFRFIGGVAVGVASVVCPMYIAEIAPAERRGALVMVAQFNIVIGILAAYLSNYLVARFVGGGNGNEWRWMFGVMAAPGLLFFLSVSFIPESPRWLLKIRRPDAALASLRLFGHAAPAQEAEEIVRSLEAEEGAVQARLWTRMNLRPLLLAAGIAALNQLDGINAVLYYTADIFRMAGASHTSALMQSVIVGLTNLVMTVVAMFLIDRVGRKMLLLVGSVTFIISHLLAAWLFYSHATGNLVLVAMMGIVGTHAYSQGAVVWVLIAELLPNAVRAAGSSVVCFLMWSLCGAISWTFPIVAHHSAAGPFLFFAAMMVVQFFLVLRFLPETKGATLEEIQARIAH